VTSKCEKKEDKTKQTKIKIEYAYIATKGAARSTGEKEIA